MLCRLPSVSCLFLLVENEDGAALLLLLLLLLSSLALISRGRNWLK